MSYCSDEEGGSTDVEMWNSSSYEACQMRVISRRLPDVPLHILHVTERLGRRDRSWSWLCPTAAPPSLQFVFSLVVPSPKGHDSPLRLYHMKMAKRKMSAIKRSACPLSEAIGSIVPRWSSTTRGCDTAAVCVDQGDSAVITRGCLFSDAFQMNLRVFSRYVLSEIY
jgi:hypothetical protein